jgi:hypothetical protein
MFLNHVFKRKAISEEQILLFESAVCTRPPRPVQNNSATFSANIIFVCTGAGYINDFLIVPGYTFTWFRGTLFVCTAGYISQRHVVMTLPFCDE